MTVKRTKEERKRQILDAARQCFAEKGYHATTVDEITERSGLTKGGLYWHFKSKWDIYRAIMLEHKNQHAGIWDRIETSSWGEETLAEAGLIFLREHVHNEWISGTTKEIEAEALRNRDIRGDFLSIIDQEEQQVVERLERAGREGMIDEYDFRSLASVLVIVVDGLCTQYHLREQKLDYEKIWRVFSRALLRGIMKRE